MSLLKEVLNKIKGPYKVALKNGLQAGKNVTVMGGVDFGSEPYLIQLHDNVRISIGVCFVNHDGGTWAFRNSFPAYKEVTKFGKIEVGEWTFIGARSIIMPGVTIGKNCVIGAGSIVTHDIPDFSVAVGAPAKVVCTTEEYAQKCLESMPADFDTEKYKQNKKEYLISTLMK